MSIMTYVENNIHLNTDVNSSIYKHINAEQCCKKSDKKSFKSIVVADVVQTKKN